MLIERNPLCCDDKQHYIQLNTPHELSLEEKNELLFVLLDHLKLGVYRATYDSSITVLAPVKE